MPRVLVPSDITLLEESLTVKQRTITLAEKLGLLFTLPVWHIRYSKNDREDMRRILSRRYDATDKSAEAEIVNTRQRMVSQSVRSNNYKAAGAYLGIVLPWWSFRKYNYQSKIFVIPFTAYGGLVIGRLLGSMITGTASDFKRDEYLRDLPARQYLEEIYDETK